MITTTLYNFYVTKILYISLYSVLLINSINAQESYRPELFFREDWKETPAEIPLSHNHLSNENLVVDLYGKGRDSLKKSHHDKPIDDPFYVWSGLCTENWMVTLKHKTHNVDLSGFAKIKLRTKQSGLRLLRIVIKNSNNKWFVSDISIGASNDWMISEINIQDINWYHLDSQNIIETGKTETINLKNIEEIGFTDLMPGGKSKACSRIDWIEVYGKPIPK